MAATDDYVGMQPFPLYGTHRSAAAVTPSDSTDLTNVSRALYIGTAGTLAVIMADGTTCSFGAVSAGTLQIAVSRVKSTGTTASNIVAMW